MRRFVRGWAIWVVAVFLCLGNWCAADEASKKSVNDAPPTSNLGQRISNFVLPASDGEQTALADFADSKAVVVVFMGTECPIGNAYVPTLGKLQDKFADQGLTVLGVNPLRADSAKEVAQHVNEFKIKFPVLLDQEQSVASLFDARRTPEVYVLDGRRTIRYRGRIDDRFSYQYKRDAAKRNDLEEAIREVLAGKPVSVPLTKADGCLITRDGDLRERGSITYAEHVAPILLSKCAGCHHPGTAAPFSLTSYELARDWSAMIKETVVQRRMPPWSADSRYGKFSNDHRLTQREINTIVGWIDDGAPLGDEKKLPPVKEYDDDGWMIGKPDVVFKMPSEYTVKAEGTVRYQYFRTPTNFKQDMWVQAAEARPGNRAVVHHIIVFYREPGSRRMRGFPAIVGTAPGEEPVVFPEGMGIRVPAGSELLWQVHYTPTGKVETDRSEVGLIFSKKPPQRAVKSKMAINRSFTIPAHDGSKRVTSETNFQRDAELLSLMPHMHLRGKDFQYWAHYPNGKSEILLSVPSYDFNWQHRYRYEKPLFIPRGTRIECVAHFDNSEANPANPDPTKDVRWGDQTWEEMMIGFINYVDAPAKTEEPSTANQDAKGSEAQPAPPAAKAEGKVETTNKDARQLPTDKQDSPKPDSDQEPPTDSAKSADDSADKDEVKSESVELGKILDRKYHFEAADKEMRYTLYVPKTYDSTKPTPLIVALHGLFSNPSQIIRYPGFTTTAEKHGYMIVAPMGFNSRGWYGSRGKGGGIRRDPKNLGELSEQDVMNVLKIIRDEFNVDKDRIYLLGHSMGGGGSLHLAMKYPDVWAAMAPIAPAVPRNLSDLERARNIPAIVIQGDKDGLVHGTRRWVEKMKELKMDHEYIEVKGGGHVLVAFQYFKEIFSFFNEHSKATPVATSAGEE